MKVFKTITHVTLLGGLALGAAAVIAGPHRVTALFDQARTGVVNTIDRHIDDPVALRHQLAQLERTYPQKIGEIRAELGELREQTAGLRREQAIAERVVELAQGDLAELQALLDQAETARAEHPTRVISVRFDRGTIPLEDAYARATQINGTVRIYETRAEQSGKALSALATQQSRLEELLKQLETERAQFQAQIHELDSQIAMIDRNEKLIEIVEERQDAIDRHERFEAHSLEQVTGRMARIQAEQEAKLESLLARDGKEGYEERAREMLRSERQARDVFESAVRSATPEAESEPIEIGAPADAGGQVATLTIG